MASARSFHTFNCIAKELIQINTQARLLIEGLQMRTGVGPVHSPLSRHDFTTKPTKTKANTKTTQTKHHNPRKRSDWRPVHCLINAGGDNIVSSQHGMAAETERGGNQNHKAIPAGEQNTQMFEIRSLRWDRSQQKWTGLVIPSDDNRADEAVPMEVDRIGEKGRRKGKGDRGKYKGDSKGYSS